MKKIFVFMSLVFSISTVTKINAQYVYYDTKLLRDLIDPATGKWKQSDKDIIANILAHYCKKSEVVSVFFNNNPFIKDLALNITDKSGISGSLNKISLASIGNLDVTNIANGISSLMIERAKQELTIAFFNRFKKFATSDYPEFQILFPKTTAILTNLLSYNYPQMLPVLRTGFFEDLKQITYNLEGVLELPRYRILLDHFPEVRIAIRTLKILHELETGTTNAADAINNFAAFPDWAEKGSLALMNTASTIKFAAIFSQSLRNQDTKKIWVTSAEIKDLITDTITTKIYLGLIYQQIKNDTLKYYLDPGHPSVTTDFADDIFAKQKDNILLLQNRVMQFISLADEVNNAYDNIRAKNLAGQKNNDSDYYNYINVSIDIIDYSFGIVKIFDQKLAIDNYLAIAKKSNALYKDIYSKQYTQAASDAMDILSGVHDLTKANTEFSANPSPAIIAEKNSALEKLTSFVEKVKPYALFMANIVEAKTSEDVKAALENAILPVGSSSIKKNTGLNVSIQSYLGAFGVTSKSNSSVSGTWSDKFGVTAPIGISVTPSFTSWQNAGSLSLFVPLFDIGAIVDYQLKKDSTVNSSGSSAGVVSKSYSVKLGQIVSPGVYLVYGFFGNVPLSLGFGAQYGPGLSKIDAGNNAVVTNPSWRWNFFLAVDLPFFNIVNKSRAK